jgi:chromosomal replication initiator protein
LPNFRRRYRGLDLLIIEDVQFFVGKQATISELLHTVDSLARDGRQVALSADRPPTQLTQLGPELSNRLCGGLVVNMQPPELETRCQILQHAAQLRSINVPEDVLRLIATRLEDDVRKLHGALHRLAATSTALQQPITTSLARQALEEVFRSSTRHVQLGDIERVVCNTFGVEPKVLRSTSRTRSVSHPRMLAMWLARKYTRAGLAEIGEFFGRRSHSTVVSAEKKVNCWRSQGQVVRMLDGDCVAEEAIRQIEARLHAG